MARLVHTLPIFQKGSNEELPGWLILTRKKSAPIAEGFDSIKGAEWDPPVKSWFVPHDRIGDALEFIEDADGIIYCADCKDGKPCEAWEKIPRLDYILRLPDELEQPNRARHEYADVVMTWREMRGISEDGRGPPDPWEARFYPNGAPPPPIEDHRTPPRPNPSFFGGVPWNEIFEAAFRTFSFFTEVPVAVQIRPLEEAAMLLGLTWPCTKDELNIAFKAAALKAHPDRGGSTEAMAKLNNAREILLKALGG